MRWAIVAAASFVAVGVVAVPVISARVPLAGYTAEQDDSPTPSTVALVETWPDGRTHYELTSPRRASMWTAAFPRVAGYTLPEGRKPVYAVQFARRLVGRDINVDISVLIGAVERPAVPVASVVIAPGSHVVVDALTRFGVQPVTLSMVDMVPTTLYRPTVVSVSTQIEVAAVELLAAPYPGYRITLLNLGSKGVANVHLQSYRLQEKAISALKRTDDGRVLMQPGDSFSFDLHLTSEAVSNAAAPGAWTIRPLDLIEWTIRPLDLIEFDSVRWDDGTYDGASPYSRVDPVVESESGVRLQLRRVIDTLRAVLAESSSRMDLLSTASERIEALPDADSDQLAAAKSAMRSTKRTVRADLTWLAENASTRTDVRTQVTLLLRRYEAWLARWSRP
ncbi:MAG TPA: hypothetical protein VGF24_30615 [Vicinamibacterales bacterium]|jgi:hypothetical protein